MKRLVVVAVLLAAVFTAASLGATFQQAGDVDADETVTKVDLDQNGDAVFTLEIRIRLNTDEKREAFEGFADDVDEDPDAAVSDFRESIESLVDRAREETGREMTVSGFAVETRSEPLPVERGIVEYRFDWDGFAADANDGIEAGDVLSGYILGDSDALVFRYPDGYEVDSVEPSPDIDDDELRWDGPRDFDDDQPRAVFVPAGEPPVDDPEDTEDGDEAEAIGAPLYVYALVLVAILAVALFAYRRNADEAAGGPSTDRPPEPVSEPEPETLNPTNLLRGPTRRRTRPPYNRVRGRTYETETPRRTHRMERSEGEPGHLTSRRRRRDNQDAYGARKHNRATGRPRHGRRDAYLSL